MEKKVPLSVKTILKLLHFKITMEQIDPNTITITNLENVVINLGYMLSKKKENKKEAETKYGYPFLQSLLEELQYLLGFACGYHDEWAKPTYDDYLSFFSTNDSKDMFHDYVYEFMSTDHFKIIYFSKVMYTWIPMISYTDKEKEELTMYLFETVGTFTTGFMDGYEKYLKDNLYKTVETIQVL